MITLEVNIDDIAARMQLSNLQDAVTDRTELHREMAQEC